MTIVSWDCMIPARLCSRVVVFFLGGEGVQFRESVFFFWGGGWSQLAYFLGLLNKRSIFKCSIFSTVFFVSVSFTSYSSKYNSLLLSYHA